MVSEIPVIPFRDDTFVSRSEKFCFRVPKLEIETSNSSFLSEIKFSNGVLSATIRESIISFVFRPLPAFYIFM